MFFSVNFKFVLFRLLSKIIIFLYEVFLKEKQYDYFVKMIRNNAVDKLIKSIFKNFKPNKQTSFFFDEPLNKTSEFNLKSPYFQYYKLILETQISNEIESQYTIITTLRFLCNELIVQKSNVINYFNDIFAENFFGKWIETFTKSIENNEERLSPISLKILLQELCNQNNIGNSKYIENTMNSPNFIQITELRLLERKQTNHLKPNIYR